jgi:hypothetical protein
LLLDAFQNHFDVAAILSNDSDLVEPIRIVSQILKKPVGLLSPVANPTRDLGQIATFIKRISISDLAASQFPDPVPHSTSRLHGCDPHGFYSPLRPRRKVSAGPHVIQCAEEGL